jgi:hypothetical protein
LNEAVPSEPEPAEGPDNGSLQREDDAAMELQSRPTDLFLGLKCPHCGHRLSLLVGRSQLTFHCLSGHLFPLRQLLQSQAQDIDRGLRAVLEVWEQKSLVLRKVVQQARSDDRAELAETFQREVEQTDGRIAALKDHLRNANGEEAGDSAVG